MHSDPDDHEGNPTPEQQAWLDDVTDAQEASKEVIRATVNTLIRSRRSVSAKALAQVLEVVAEELQHEIAYSVDSLHEAGFESNYTAYPEDHERFIAGEHERLVDALRPKRLDALGLVLDILRPVPTNPATRGDL